jgi:hypothetical protein
VFVRIVDIGGIVDHHCLEVFVRIVDIGGIVDHHCNKSTNINKTNNYISPLHIEHKNPGLGQAQICSGV